MKIDGIGAIGRFLGHIICGIIVFIAIAIAATGIDNLVGILKEWGASEFTLTTLTYLSHLMMSLDFLLVGFWTVVSALRFGKELYKGGA